MSIFPDLGPTYYDEKDRGLLNMMEYHYTSAITINQSFWTEADTDTRFECNDQTLWNDLYGNLPSVRRRNLSFNRIRPIKNMVGGYQRRNRKSTIITPVENADNETADQYTKILYWVNQDINYLDTISSTFDGALVTGMNLIYTWMDYRSDPINGDIRCERCAYNSFLIDPYFKKQDLSDCNFIWKRSYVTHKEAVSLMPERSEDIWGLPGEDSNRDGKFQFMPESYNYGVKNLLTYDEFWYRDFREQTILVDTRTGESTEWMGKDEEDLKIFLKLNPEITTIKGEVPTVRLGIVIQGRVFYDGPNPMGIDKYPFVPVFGYYNPQMPYFPDRIQGIVRGLRDAQYLYNRRKIIELDILESQINSGYKYKPNSLVNPKDIFLTGQGRGLAIKDEANMEDVQRIEAPGIPQSMIELSNILAKEMTAISGVNEELLGSAQDDKSGILSMLRQGAGLTTLQSLFDGLDYAQKLLGSLHLSMIQKNFTPGKVQRIINGQPSPQFYNQAFGKYDAAVEEGLNTTTQKQLQFAQLLQLREAGIEIPSSVLLEASTMQNKNDLIKAVQGQEEQAAQAQQLQQEVAMEEIKARTELAKSRAIADQGLGVERLSRVQENQALAEERKAEAVKDLEKADLDYIEQLAKIQEILQKSEINSVSQLSSLVALAEKLSSSKNMNIDQRPPEQGLGVRGENLAAAPLE